MAERKFRDGDRVAGREEGPADYRCRIGTIIEFGGRGGYRVRFDDTGTMEYLNSGWLRLVSNGRRATVPVKLEVKSCDKAVKLNHQAAAQRVLDEFGNSLPDLRLLAFFDDEDCSYFRQEFGANNRGLYTPIKTGFQWEVWPQYVKECILVDDPSSSLLKQDVDHVIYLYGSTCADQVGLIMTFSHELQHFIQYGFNRKLWAENFLLPRLPRDVIDAEGLNWPDIPHEREARIVAKRIGVKLCGADAVKRYLDLKISESLTPGDVADLRFSQHVDPSTPYDLADETKRIFQRLKPHRQHLETSLDKMRADVDFKNLDLSSYFGEEGAAL
jgi:hypothetical protein